MKPCLADFEVRDYECDYQGVVNNAVYFHYLEHARHTCLSEKINVPLLSREHGIDLVLASANIRYLKPLYPRDRFTVYTAFELKGEFRLLFSQNIRRGGEEIISADAVVAAVQRERPIPFRKVTAATGFIFPRPGDYPAG